MAVSTIEETEARFAADPATAKTSPAVTATLVNGRARLSAGPFNWDADLPASIGGQNLAPSPTAYLLGALAGCAVAFLNDTLAPQFGVRIDDVTAVVRGSADLRGLLGIDGAAADIGDLQLDIQMTSPDGPERTEPMLQAWRERCPIYLALLKPNTIAFQASVSPAS
ncbi:MAG: OsmC family protein [Chloroflexi bacterium]|nr:OsmC family protein [Chloroflexota bacterium]